MATDKSMRYAWMRGTFVVCGTLLAAYLTLVTQCFTSGLSLRVWGMITVGVMLMLGYIAGRLQRKPSGKKFVALASLLAASVLFAFLLFDTAYHVILYRVATPLPFAFEQTRSTGGLEVNLGIPRYRVTEGGRNKPHAVIGGLVFGELVPPALVDDRQFRQQVVETRRVEYRIDEYGYRNDPQIWASAPWLALGDSFVFGASIDAADTWVSRLGETASPLYNMGESGTAPAGQWERFREQYQRSPTTQLKTIVWMIFGGNDLDSPAGSEFGGDSSQVVADTVLVGPLRAIEAVRDKAVLSRVRTGTLRPLRYEPAYWFNEQLLPAPLYQSAKLGAKLFYPPYIYQACRDKKDVLSDESLQEIERVFSELQQEADKLGWHTLIVFAPSAEHLLGSQFESFPAIAEDSFEQWTSEAAVRHGFAYLDLSDALLAGCQTMLPYFRDDTHWNAWGHEIAFQQIHDKLSLLDWIPNAPSDP
jgi:hypothetical protein